MLSKVWDYLVPVYRQGVPGVPSTDRQYSGCCLQTESTEGAVLLSTDRLHDVLSTD